MKENLNDIREMRKLIIQNLNTVNALEVSIRNISSKVNKKEKGEASKFFALTVVLGFVIILAFYFYFRAEVAHYKENLNTVLKQEEYLKKDVSELKEKLFSVENNDIKAYNLYIALKEREADKAIKMYANFNLSALSRLERLIIDREVSLIKQKAAVIKYEEGETLFKRKSYIAAVEKFKESTEISSTGEHVPSLFYLTALSQYRLKDYNKSAISFERFLFVNTKKSFQKDKAELLLGVCYEKLKQYERAVNFYIQVLRESKYSRFKPTIKDRIKILERKLDKQKNAGSAGIE